MEKRKNYIILFLLFVIVALSIGVLLNGAGKELDAVNTEYQYTQVLSEDTYASDSDIEAENVCTNFLKTFYSVQHSTSQNSALSDCKKFLTNELYNKLSRDGEGAEYSEEEIDVDYSSNISVRDIFKNTSDSKRLLVNCMVNTNINGIKNSNEYFVIFKLVNSNSGYLIDDFELISVQGG